MKDEEIYDMRQWVPQAHFNLINDKHTHENSSVTPDLKFTGRIKYSFSFINLFVKRCRNNQISFAFNQPSYCIQSHPLK